MASHYKWLVVLLAVAFFLRVAAGGMWQSRLEQRFAMGDSDGYWTLGMCLAQGQPYQYGSEDYRVFRTPGYPAVLSPILWAFGDSTTALYLARAEAAFLGTLAVAAVWWIACLLSNAKTALLAAAFATFYPGAIVLSVLILSEAPFCPLMLVQLALWILAWRAKTSKSTAIYAVFAGFAAGAATLMRPSWLLFTPFAAGVGMLMALGDKKNLLRHLFIASWMISGLVVLMLPWWIRNVHAVGRFVPTTLQVGASLYDGLSPTATGASNMDFVPEIEAKERAARPPANGQFDEPFEVRLDRRMREESLSWVKSHPYEALALAGTKFIRFWNIWPNDSQIANRPMRLAVLFTYPPLLIFAIIGAWKTFAWGWPYRLCWLPAVYLTLLHMVFVSSLRYRDPAMLALLVLAAVGFQTIRNGRLRPNEAC